ncbi:MAG: translocation/assembly module TamB domain-containing protein [Reyranella sp.]|nr:translocation/assembly module TamB domain-containing protein [Reyranella sp.]
MRGRRILLFTTGTVAALLALVFGVLQTPPGQRILASALSAAASTQERRVELSGLTGFFPTDLRLARIEFADRGGPWLTVADARLRWSFASLLSGRLRIETLSAARIDLLRVPEPAKTPDAVPAESGPLRLPVGIDLQALAVDDLHLAAALAGVEARWRLGGSAFLPADLAEGRLRLSGDRTDGRSGHLSADIRFDAGQRTVDGEIALDEGPGGVVAALLKRPELDRVGVRLAARGDATAGSAELTLSAGDAATANGKAKWEPQGTATAVSVRLDVAGPGLPPGPLADAARGPASLTVDAIVDDRLVTLNEARLTAGPLGLVASGRYDRAADRLAATATLDAAEPGAFAALLDGVGWRDLRLQATADLRTLATRPAGTIVLEGGADDLALAAIDPRLPPPGKLTLASRLALRDGAIVVESLELGSPLASAKGSGTYVVATKTGEVKANVALPSLAPLSAFAEQPLTGSAAIDLTARIEAGDLTLGWQGTLGDFGVPGVPHDLVAPTVSLAGSASLKRDDSWSLAGVRIASEGGALAVTGHGRGPAGTLDLALDLPKLGILQPEVEGALTANATVGFGQETELKLKAELRDLRHGQLASRRLSLAATTTLDATGAARGTVEASGDLAGQPLSLGGRFARDAAGGIVVPNFQGRWASAVLDVADLAVTEARTSGHARLRMARLQEIADLLGTDVAGSLDTEVTADPGAPAGRLDVRVQGTDLLSGGVAIGALDLAGTVDDPTGIARTDATLRTSRVAGAAGLNGVNGTLKGDRNGLDIALQATGVQTNGSVAARVELAGEQIRIALSRLEGRHEGIPIALTAPARVTIAGARITIEPATLRLGGGRLSVRGTVDPVASDLRLELAALPLSLIDAFAPGTGLDGTLQAKLHVQGPSDAPRIDATYTASNLRLRRPDAALLPVLSLQGTGSLVGRRATVDARLGAGGATRLALKGSATLPQGTAPLSATAALSGTLDVAPFAPLLGDDIRGIAGTLRPNLTLDIRDGKVSGSGTIDLAGGVIALPESGLRLSGGEGRLVMQGETLQVQRLAFQTAGNGSVTVGGSLRIDAAQGLGLDLTVASRRALLVSRADLVATVSSDLKVTGSTTGGIDIAGPITIDRAEIAVGTTQSVDYPVLEVREINKRGAPAPVAAAPPPGQKRRPPPSPTATPIRLALTIDAPRAVFVRGRGLDAEMGGRLQVGGTPAAPSVVGGLTLRRGDFTLGGRRLTFSRGIVTLDNLDTIDPQLDFLASTTVRSTTVGIAITGTARAPVLAINSALPPDEAMALLIFGKPASGLSASELVQVAQAIAELTGNSLGDSVVGRLRRGLRLDRLSVGSSGKATQDTSASSVSVEAGRYVAPGVYVGARQGASGTSSRGVVQVEVFDNVKVEGDIGADSNGRVGVKMEWDY